MVHIKTPPTMTSSVEDTYVSFARGVGVAEVMSKPYTSGGVLISEGNLPTSILESVAVLRMLTVGSSIEGVGRRINKDVYALHGTHPIDKKLGNP